MIERNTIFSPDRLFRYTLWRQWDAELMLTECDAELRAKAGKFLMVIGLNPSTADEKTDDPTIRRCTAFAKHWGYGALCMTNLFAYRATLPKDMKAYHTPIGEGRPKDLGFHELQDGDRSLVFVEKNDLHLYQIAKEAGLIIAAWGTHGKHLGRDRQVLNLLDRMNVNCLRKTKDKFPEHPLYIPGNTQPIPFP